MITVYFSRAPELHIPFMDIEAVFSGVHLACTDTEKYIVDRIDHGRLVSPRCFIDRFGFKLPIEFLSTSCKTVLTVYHMPERIIDCTEAGADAVDLIFECCHFGSIVLPNSDLGVRRKCVYREI